MLGADRVSLPRFVRPWRRAPSLTCNEVRPSLPAILDRSAPASASLVAHVEYCLACQAELGRYKRLLRLCHQLQATDVPVPPGIVADILASIEVVAKRRAIRSVLTGRRIAYGSAVAGAAVAGGALLAVAILRSQGTPTPGARAA
jgi:hypothetical protein